MKTILQDGWGGTDGELLVSDEPHWLRDNDGSLEIARAITLGTATRYLPTIYVSATGPGDWVVSEDQIRKLAFDMGGVAHVVVEPNRAFSFRVRDLTKGANAYGGTLAIAAPAHGVVRRFFLGFRHPLPEDLVFAVRDVATDIRAQMPADGWDWTELQEQALRRQRARDRNRLSAEETEALYQEEIANLRERVAQLEGQIASRVPDSDADEGWLSKLVVERLGPEIYPGEFLDRLRFAAKECSDRADQSGLDRRSKVVFDAFVSKIPASPALSELLEDLKRATKNPKRMAPELISLLSRHGYREKSDNKHIRLEAEDGYGGLDALTLPKTPSENRGLKNLRSQIERTLGIAKLSV